MLQKELWVNEKRRKELNPDAMGVDHDGKTNDYENNSLQRQRDIDVLVKLLPYYDIDLSTRNNTNSKAKELRQMLCISRSEADNLFKNTNISTLHDLMNTYFDQLL